MRYETMLREIIGSDGKLFVSSKLTIIHTKEKTEFIMEYTFPFFDGIDTTKTFLNWKGAFGRLHAYKKYDSLPEEVKELFDAYLVADKI